jgi:hypothetical protein
MKATSERELRGLYRSTRLGCVGQEVHTEFWRGNLFEVCHLNGEEDENNIEMDLRKIVVRTRGGWYRNSVVSFGRICHSGAQSSVASYFRV